MRADGVVCCHVNTQRSGVNPGIIQGKGEVSIGLDKNNLASGLYRIKFSVYDKDNLHPFLHFEKR